MSLPDALSALYDTFSGVPKPSAVPGCPCCQDQAKLCVLVKKPLRELTADELCDYGCSVFLTAGSEADFHYLLPRLLEVGATTPGWWPSPEVLLGKLKLAGWKAWPVPERRAVQTVLDAWYDTLFALSADIEQSGWSDFASEFDEFVCGVGRAGADVGPYLDGLMEPQHRAQLQAFYWLNVSGKTGRVKLQNAFWQDEPDGSAAVLAFLQRRDVEACASR